MICRLVLAGVCGALVCTSVQATEHNSEPNDLRPRLGQPVDESEVERLTVFSDGEGLPVGSGTASAGKALYGIHCLSCHGAQGQGGINDALAGGENRPGQAPASRAIGVYWPYATPIFDYVRRAMPYHTPGMLDADQTYSVVAYLLYLNGLLGVNETLDAERLSRIQMPARARFFSVYPLP